MTDKAQMRTQWTSRLTLLALLAGLAVGITLSTLKAAALPSILSIAQPVGKG